MPFQSCYFSIAAAAFASLAAAIPPIHIGTPAVSADLTVNGVPQYVLDYGMYRIGRSMAHESITHASKD